MARGKKNAKAETPSPEESVLTATPEVSNTEPQGDTPSSAPDAAEEPEAPRIEEIPLPFTARINVALAVLRMAPDSPLMEVRPVGTLPLGTPVTITAIHEGCARLRNGLWIKADFLTPDSAKDTKKKKKSGAPCACYTKRLCGPWEARTGAFIFVG